MAFEQNADELFVFNNSIIAHHGGASAVDSSAQKRGTESPHFPFHLAGWLPLKAAAGCEAPVGVRKLAGIAGIVNYQIVWMLAFRMCASRVISGIARWAAVAEIMRSGMSGTCCRGMAWSDVSISGSNPTTSMPMF